MPPRAQLRARRSSPLSFRVRIAARISPDLWRFGQAQRDEIRTADLETHVPKPLEVVAQLSPFLQRERDEWRVRCERIRERHDARGVEWLGAEPLHDSGRPGDRADDQVGVPAADLEPVEPVRGLVGRHRPRECLQSETPRRHIERKLVPQRSCACEQRSRLVVAAEMRMNRSVDTELAESADSVRGSRIVEQCDQLVP